MILSDVALWPFLPALVFAVLLTLGVGHAAYEARNEKKRQARERGHR